MKSTNELIGVIKFARAWAYVRNETTSKEYRHLVDIVLGRMDGDHFTAALFYHYGFKI